MGEVAAHTTDHVLPHITVVGTVAAEPAPPVLFKTQPELKAPNTSRSDHLPPCCSRPTRRYGLRLLRQPLYMFL